MASLKERQVSFAGGELSQTLWGRTDLDRYPVGARTLLNFFVTPHGVISNRPGTRFVDRVTIGTSELTSPIARVVPFVFSETDVVLLVFTHHLIEFYVLDSDTDMLVSDGTLVTGLPASSGGLRPLRFAQVGNVMTIVGVGNPLELRRTSSGPPSTWTIEEIDFDVPEAPSWCGTARIWDPSTGSPSYAISALVELDALAGNNSHPPREWTWAVTRIMRDGEGRLYETMPETVTEAEGPAGTYVTVPAEVAVYPDWLQRLVWDTTTPGADDDALVATRVYRGRDGVLGYIGETKGEFFVDDGIVPDFSSPPPQGLNPFKVYDAAGALLRTETPTVVSFFENRRCLAATEERPNFAWLSASDDYENFDEVVPATDDDSIAFGLTSNRHENIRAMVPRAQLVAFTSSSIRLIAGSGENQNISPLSVAAREFRKHGCGDLDPVSIDSAIFFMQAKRTVPKAMIFEGDSPVRVDDVSIFSRHLFDGHTIVDWAYSEDPFSILWVVRSDGALLSLTWIKEHQVMAWALHEISGDGVVESVAAVPEGDEDAVYLVVKRDTTRTLERLATRVLFDIRDAVFVDGSVTHDGRKVGIGGLYYTSTATVSDALGNDGDVGEAVEVTFDGDLGLGTLVGQVVQLDDPDGGPPLQLRIDSNVGAVYTATVLNIAVPSGLWDVEVERESWFFCTLSVTGLSHLEGETVVALADGNVVRDLVVTGGAVTFSDYVAIAHVGLSYNSDFESLDAINERGKQKIVKDVTLELEGARGGYVGPDLDTLTEVRTREVEDSYGVIGLQREEVRVSVYGKWGAQGRVAFRQSDPLPVTILGITRDVEYGG